MNPRIIARATTAIQAASHPRMLLGLLSALPNDEHLPALAEATTARLVGVVNANFKATKVVGQLHECLSKWALDGQFEAMARVRDVLNKAPGEFSSPPVRENINKMFGSVMIKHTRFDPAPWLDRLDLEPDPRLLLNVRRINPSFLSWWAHHHPESLKSGIALIRSENVCSVMVEAAVHCQDNTLDWVMGVLGKDACRSDAIQYGLIKSTMELIDTNDVHAAQRVLPHLTSIPLAGLANYAEKLISIPGFEPLIIRSLEAAAPAELAKRMRYAHAEKTLWDMSRTGISLGNCRDADGNNVVHGFLDPDMQRTVEANQLIAFFTWCAACEPELAFTPNDAGVRAVDLLLPGFSSSVEIKSMLDRARAADQSFDMDDKTMPAPPPSPGSGRRL